jgi:hypothetical protein
MRQTCPLCTRMLCTPMRTATPVHCQTRRNQSTHVEVQAATARCPCKAGVITSLPSSPEVWSHVSLSQHSHVHAGGHLQSDGATPGPSSGAGQCSVIAALLQLVLVRWHNGKHCRPCTALPGAVRDLPGPRRPRKRFICTDAWKCQGASLATM